MRPYSTDLRERVAAAVDNREGPPREIARRFRVDLSFIVRLLPRRRDANALEPEPHAGGPPPVLGPDDHRRLAELIGGRPDATLRQLKQRGGFTRGLKALWLALRKQGLTRKKKGLRADEQDRPGVQAERRSFRRKVKRVGPERLVFVGETGVATAMAPAYARAPGGERAADSAPGPWESVTVIAALGPDGVRAPLAFPGPTDAVTFESYTERVPVPELHEGDVVVFDNPSAHPGPAVAKAIEGVGAGVPPLPPYGPDYAPIEEMSSKAKAFLRRVAARVKGDLYDAIGDALRGVTDQDIIGRFKDAGLYAAHG